MPPGGYFSQALVVDITDGTSERPPLPDDIQCAEVLAIA